MTESLPPLSVAKAAAIAAEKAAIATKQAADAALAAKTAEASAKILAEVARKALEEEKNQLKLFLDNSMFHAIFNTIADGAIVVDLDGKFLFNNQAALNIIGLDSLQTTKPVDFVEYFHEYKPDMITPWTKNEDPLARALRGKTTIGEIMYVKNNKTGINTFVSAMSVPLSYGYGNEPKVIGAFLLFRKIQQLSGATI